MVGGGTLTYRALADASNRVANALIDRGVIPGDRVAVLAENSLEYLEVFLGILKAGACAVPLPTLIAPAALRLMIGEAAPRVVFCSSAYHDAVSGLATVVGFEFGPPDGIEYAQFRNGGRPDHPDVAIGPDDLFNIIYSSGTTGQPKGIVHTHAFRAQFVADVETLALFEVGSRFVAATPFYSNATIGPIFAMLGLGCEMIGFRKFDLDGFFALCGSGGPRHVLLVPVQIGRILDDPRTGAETLAHGMTVYSTGSKLSGLRKGQVLSRWQASLIESYGMTEGGPGTTLRVDPSTPADKLDSVGQPALGCEIRLLDEHGVEVPHGQTGEIVGRSRMQMAGYYLRPEATEQQLWRDRQGREFIRSGDIGRFDADGYLYLLDRKKEMIISGGFNIYASDLEAVLLSHPSVLEAAVIGVPSDQWGETPVALVVPRPDSGVDPAELLAWANSQLGKAQRISRLDLRDALPRGGLGKVLKAQLKAELAVLT